MQGFLKTLFNKGEQVCFGRTKFDVDSTGFEVVPEGIQYVTLNPCTYRNDESVTAFRNFLVEIDTMDLSEQEELIERHYKMPFSTKVFSGKKSYHYVISVESPFPSEAEWRKVQAQLLTIIKHADQSTKNPSRFTRLGGGTRDNGQVQHVVQVRGRVKNEELLNWIGQFPEAAKVKEFKRQQTGGVMATDIEDPKIRGNLSAKTALLLLNGCEKGQRHKAVVAAAYDYQEQKYTEEEALEELSNSKGCRSWWDKNAEDAVLDIFRKREGKNEIRLKEQEAKQVRLKQWAEVTEDKEIGTDNKIMFFVEKFMEKAGISCTSSQALVNKANDYVPTSVVLDQMKLVRHSLRLEPLVELVQAALNEWKRKKAETSKELLHAELLQVDRPAGEAQLDRYVRAVFSPLKFDGLAPYEFEKGAIKQSLWQVKQKLKHKKTSNHTMLAIHGRQGSGKSWALDKLLEPIQDCVSTPSSVACVKVDSGRKKFSEFLVIKFDEMAKADATDVESLKEIITSPMIEFKPHYTHDTDRRPNIATFFATTNKHLRHLIKDSTGARRFIELRSIDRDIREDLAAQEEINSIKYKELWMVVGADDACPILEPKLYKALTLHQDRDIRHQDAVEKFIELDGWEVTADTAEYTKLTDMVSNLNDFLTNAKYSPQSLLARLEEMGIDGRRKKKGWYVGLKKQGFGAEEF
jgi:Virulence-associated protein E